MPGPKPWIKTLVKSLAAALLVGAAAAAAVFLGT
jgi:hypothetical protein